VTCDCIKQINEQIGAEHNAILVTTLFGTMKAVIDTEKLDSKKRGKPPVMLATYCPFCGTKYS
jgi:hypothetical protein